MSAVLQANLVSQTGGGGGETQCASVTFDPNDGDRPVDVILATTTAGAHIFYTLTSYPNTTNPTHSGDSATGITTRIGSSTGVVSIPGGGGAGVKQLRALAYQLGLIDSPVTSSGPYIGTGGGP